MGLHEISHEQNKKRWRTIRKSNYTETQVYAKHSIYINWFSKRLSSEDPLPIQYKVQGRSRNLGMNNPGAHLSFIYIDVTESRNITYRIPIKERLTPTLFSFYLLDLRWDEIVKFAFDRSVKSFSHTLYESFKTFSK